MIEGRDRVLRLRWADLGEGAEFLGVDANGLFGDALSGGRAGKGGLVFDAAEEARAGVARTGAGGAAIADPELFEALGARRRLERPAAVRADFEQRKLGSAGDHDLRARGGFIGDGPTVFAGVFLVEGDGLGDPVGPGGEKDAYRLGQGAGQSAHGLAGAFERGQRGVGSAGGLVIALGADVQVHGQGDTRQEECEQPGKTERHGHPDTTAAGQFPQAFLAT